MPIDEQDNPVIDVDDPTGQQDNTGGSGDNEDFLVVNDRTRFRSQEDAIKSFNEAGERIAQLSGWEKEMTRYGVTDPRVASQLLDELVQLREQRAAAEKAAKEAERKPQTTSAATTTSDDVLSQEDANALAWLKKHAPRLGYISKDELTKTVEELKTEIKGLQEGSESTRNQYFEEQRAALVDSGRESVRGWMSEQKIVDGPEGEKMIVIESLIRDWVNEKDERVRQFYAGPSASRAVVKEGFDRAVKVLGWGKAAQAVSSSASFAQSKGAAMARNGKRLPQHGVASRQQAAANDGVKVDAGGRKDHIGSALDKAWEVASKHFNGHSSE